MGAKLQKNHSRAYSNDNWIKFNKGGMGIRILYKREKWIWDVYSKEKWFWEDEGNKLRRVGSKNPRRREGEKFELKFLTQLIRGKRKEK